MTHAERVAACIYRQTDPSFPWELRRYGCRVMCLLAIPQYVTGRCLSDEQINEIVDRGNNTIEVITSNDRVKMLAGKREHRLINWAFSALGSHRHGRQVGWELAHVDTVEWQYMIVHWDTGGDDGHYTLHDRAGVLLYDPWDASQIGYEVELKSVQRQLLYATWKAGA